MTRRFWVPSGHGYAVDGSGFLSDPESTVGGVRWSNVDALTVDDLRHCRSLVLLGEPGMGKSTFLTDARPLLPENCEAEEDFHKLAEFGSEDRLVRSVFESRRVKQWLAGSGELCLTLDGFDDAQTRIRQLGSLVAGFLSRWPIERLWLRIVCRTADWPQSLAGELSRLAPGSKVVELLPLRRTDIADMALDTQVDPELFLAAVETRGVGVLAARPLTLGFLLHTFTTSGRRLPERVGDLYRDNLLAMCDEHNSDRRTASPPPYSAGDLYAVARRIAAVTVFGGATAVWLGPIPRPTGEDLVAVDDLVGGSEPRDGDSVFVTRSMVGEVTRTPLFSGHGEARMGWAHTTFQDFLAADWLLANELPNHQVRSLVLADDGGVRPQVRRVAAWAVSLAPDQFSWLTEADPESFVGEVDIPDPSLRQVLVHRLLAAANADQLLDRAGRYSGLAHPDLANQLAPVLAQPGPGRWLAIRLANDCDVVECDQALAAIALDPEAPMHERVAAGAALTWHKRARDTLLPLVLDPELRRGDDRHQLLGVGLLASWPHALPTSQALDAVTAASTRNRRALFGGFVDELIQTLTINDLPAAVTWLMKNTDTPGDGVLARVRNACLKLCANHFNDPDAAAAAVTATKAQLLQHNRVLTDDESFPDDARRRLALLIARAADTDTDTDLLAMLVCDPGALLSADDFLWLLDLAREKDAVEDDAIHRLLPRLVDPTRIDHVHAVLGVNHASSVRSALSYWLDTCHLTDPAVAEIRANWQRMRERRARRENLQDNIEDHIVTHLDNFESGDRNGYWLAARLVCVRPGTNHYHDEYQPDLTAHPRWESLTPSIRDRLVSLAPRYLIEGRCVPEEWLGKERNYFPAQAAYRAMLLLLRLNPAALDMLTPTVWQEWVPIIVDWPVISNGAQPQDKEHLLRHALPHAGEQLRVALLTVIDDTIRTGKSHWTRTECDLLWDDRLQQELTRRLTGQLPDDARAELATTLMRNAPDAAQPLLLSWLGHGPERSRLAATLLLSYRAAQAWPAIHHWFHTHPDDAEKVFLDQAHHRDVSPDLHVDALADLYLWLWDRFPPDDDPHDDEAHWITPRESVGRFRDRLLERLRQAGTTESLTAIRRIVHTHPETGWLNRVYTAARAVHREATWQPTPPTQLRLLAENSRRRLVRTEKELLDAVTAALATIQRRLVGETPESHLLWNTTPQRRPKSEDEISDYLRNRWTDELAPHHAIVNREVQVRRNAPSGIGERTDLRIEAITPDGDAITVVIEVKNAWNDEVTTNLHTQLVGQYMHDIGTTVGIFLVIWASPESWSASAPTGKVNSIARAALVEHLDQQASEQADHGRDIRVVHLDISYLRPQDRCHTSSTRVTRGLPSPME